MVNGLYIGNSYASIDVPEGYIVHSVSVVNSNASVNRTVFNAPTWYQVGDGNYCFTVSSPYEQIVTIALTAILIKIS